MKISLTELAVEQQRNLRRLPCLEATQSDTYSDDSLYDQPFEFRKRQSRIGKMACFVSGTVCFLPMLIIRRMRSRRRIAIVRWPESVARALLLAGVKTEASIRLAAKWFLEARDDLSKFREVVATLESIPAGTNEASIAEDLLARGRRQLRRYELLLSDLQVEVKDVARGEHFDCELHEPVGTREADSCNVADTVSETLSPGFVWRNEFGDIQVIPAKVYVFAGTSCCGDDSCACLTEPVKVADSSVNRKE